MASPSHPSLPRLRRARRPLSVARVAGLVHRGIANINATVEPVAAYWDDHNTAALAAEGPLWVALGDSVTQGIGATHPGRSYAARVLDELRRETGEPWRLVNLSMSGGRFEDVVHRQLPAMQGAGLEPDIVTAVIGSNDVIWRRDTDGIISDARLVVDSLPSDALLSRVSEARLDRRRRGVNEVFEAAQQRGAVTLFEAWQWPTGVGVWAEDKFHPNEAAYRYIADNVWQAMCTRLDGSRRR